MSPRTKILVGFLFAGLCLYQASEYITSAFITEPNKTLSSRIKKYKNDISKYNKSIKAGQAANEQLPEWEKQSLPEDTDRARVLYKKWLIQLVERAGLSNTNVEAKSSVSTKKNAYKALSFTLRGKGTLEHLTAFLYEFYHSNMLHKIGSLSLNPAKNSDQIDISISIEALSMKGNKRDYLNSQERSQRLASQDVIDYRKVISRNFFSVGGEFDPVNLTRLSGITYSSRTGQQQAWFTLGATDERLELQTGDELVVGEFSGTILKIETSDLVLESGGSRWLLSIGENLDEAYALPANF